jgi:hypothetical protein
MGGWRASPGPEQLASFPAPPVDPAATSPQPSPADSLRRLHRQAAGRYATIDCYTVQLTRREVVNGKGKPEEVVFFQFRKQPWSVYMKWVGKEGQGREVVYVKGQYKNEIHTKVAAGDSLVLRAGQVISLAPTNPLVRKESRHSITDAGVGNLVEQYGRLLDAQEKGDRRLGSLTYLGSVNRPEFAAAVEGVEQVIPPGSEPQLPRGGRRLWFFDSKELLPLLATTTDERGQEVEYYCYANFRPCGPLSDDAFNPDKLWGGKR